MRRQDVEENNNELEWSSRLSLQRFSSSDRNEYLREFNEKICGESPDVVDSYFTIHVIEPESQEVTAYEIEYPLIRDERIKSYDQLEEILNEEFAGITVRPDFSNLMRMARRHLEFLDHIYRIKQMTISDIRSLSAELGIANQTALHWIVEGAFPYLYRIVDCAKSNTEWEDVTHIYRKALHGIRSWKEIEARLGQLFPNTQFDTHKHHAGRKQRACGFLRILEGREGGTVKGIARRTNTSRKAVAAFLEARPPLYIALVMDNWNSIDASSRIPTRIQVPMVKGVEISSDMQLMGIIERDYLGLSEREEFPIMLQNAMVYLKLYQRYGRNSFVPKGLIPFLEEETGVSRSNLRRYLIEGGLPELYNLLNEVTTHSDSIAEIESISERIDNISNHAEMDQRFSRLYGHYYLQQRRNYEKSRKQALSFFKVLRTAHEYTVLDEISRVSEVPKHRVLNWLQRGHIPNHVLLASQIPREPPRIGKKWLPLSTGSSGDWDSFIEVPTEIESAGDIQFVLGQISPLQNKWMKGNEGFFADCERGMVFMWLLGILTSDGCFGRTGKFSNYVTLTASKKYPWSEKLGTGFCHSLGELCIRSRRVQDVGWVEDNITKSVSRKWNSRSSPIFTWTKRTLLGVGEVAPKNETGVSARWILAMPYKWRVAFLQGCADGDGWASTRSFTTGIATHTNQKLLQKVFQSVGIDHAIATPITVIIHAQDDINKLVKLPLFRFATGRQERLARLSRITGAMSLNNRRRVSEWEKKKILKLYKKGYTTGMIAETLWEEFAIPRYPSHLRKIAKQEIG